MQQDPTQINWGKFCTNTAEDLYGFTTGSLISHLERRSCIFRNISKSEPSGVCTQIKI